MKYVKWIFVVLLFSSLTSFVEKDRPTAGLDVGDVAPDFKIQATLGKQPIDLHSTRGKYVLLNFWASYDAQSRMQNVSLNHAVNALPQNIEMVSVSFDEYESVFNETIRKDRLQSSDCYLEIAGKASSLFKKYNLERGFKNYLLDKQGVIIAKDLTASELSTYLN